MASFEVWIGTPGKRRYNRVHNAPLYSDSPQDAGNFNSAGQLVGTMRSISAPAWEAWTGSTPSAADMQSITVQQAYDFYKAKIWDAVKGDEIKSQIIAEMLADMKSSAGGNGVKQIQKALGITQDGGAGPQTIEAINAADSAELYEKFRTNMLDYYQSLGGYWQAGWARDMEKYYPQRDKNDPIFEGSGNAIFSINRIMQPENLGTDFIFAAIIFAAVSLIIRRKFF
jgi:lysozyme family protein